MTFDDDATNQCRKRPVVAILKSVSGDIFIGENRVTRPQATCPRVDAGCKDGGGWDLCKNVCGQQAHAEVDALQQAGEAARGGRMLLVGHWRACDDCQKHLNKLGVALEVVSESFSLPTVENCLEKLEGEDLGQS